MYGGHSIYEESFEATVQKTLRHHIDNFHTKEERREFLRKEK